MYNLINTILLSYNFSMPDESRYKIEHTVKGNNKDVKNVTEGKSCFMYTPFRQYDPQVFSIEFTCDVYCVVLQS